MIDTGSDFMMSPVNESSYNAQFDINNPNYHGFTNKLHHLSCSKSFQLISMTGVSSTWQHMSYF